MPRTFVPTPPARIVEAPPEVAELILQWHDSGRSATTEAALAEALQPYRGAALRVGYKVVWLSKVDDRRDDVVRLAYRSRPG